MGYSYDGVALGLAAQIRALREVRGWSQRELAQKAGISVDGVCRLENPRVGHDPDTRPLLKIAAAFDVALVARFLPVGEMVAGLAGNRSPEQLAPKSFTEEYGA